MMNRVLRKIKVIIDNFLLKKYSILKKYSNSTFEESLFFLFHSFLLPKKNKNIPVFNFLITSKAELRVFKPILNMLMDFNSIRAIVIYLNHTQYELNFEKKIKKSNNIKITHSIYPIIYSFNNKQTLNVICLDHQYYKKQHKQGIEIIDYINSLNGKTVCIQHGGIQKDNMTGQSTSESIFQIVYGQIMKNYLLDAGYNSSKIFISGNPLHDSLHKVNKERILNILTTKNILNNKKNILLATCLHTEYSYRIDEEESYKKYIKTIYENIDYNKYNLIIKMHPNDSTSPNIYENELINQNSDNIYIIKPDDSELTTYDYIFISDLVISRASTVIEESLIMNKKVIAFDLYEEGPSKHYSILHGINNYKRIVGDNINLQNEINLILNNNKNELSIFDDLVKEITYKLDGNSSNRVINSLIEISSY